MKSQKLKSSSLLLTLAICSIVLLLLGLLNADKLLTARASFLTIERYQLSSQFVEEIANGKSSLEYPSEKDAEYWGLMELQSQLIHGPHYQFHQLFFKGYSTPDPNLYLPDNNRILSLGGKAAIEGCALIPKATTKRASLRAVPYNAIRPSCRTSSSKHLPGLVDFDERWQHTWGLLNSAQTPDKNPSFIERSFDQTALKLSVDDTLLLSECRYSGKVILHSTKAVVVDSTAVLEDVILLAPHILLKSGVSGRMQLISTRAVIIEPEVRLDYPSFVALKPEHGQYSLDISGNTELSGGIFLVGDRTNSPRQGLMIIRPEAEVYGLVYSDGPVHLEGQIHGHLYARDLVYHKETKSLSGHLIHGQVTNDLNPHFLIPLPLSDQEEHGKIMHYAS